MAALVTGIAAIHYFYMRGVWIETGQSPVGYRYVDWLLTVPLQIIEFYLILAAITVVSSTLFWRLMLASVFMLVAGYMGEVGDIGIWVGFTFGMLGWLYIIYEVFAGEAGKISASQGTVASQTAFNALRMIVTVGWSIYPIGYVIGYAHGGSVNMLNIIYNLADFVNKIAFGVVIWKAATSSTEKATA